MKKTLLLFVFLGIGTSIFSQIPDTAFVTMRQDTGAFEPQQFSNHYDWVIGSKQAIRSLFKVNPIDVGPPVSLLNLSYERKISPAFSLQAGAGFGIQTGSDFNKVDTFSVIGTDTFFAYPSYSYWSLHYSLEAKWYYNMARRIREGRSADNMTGNYFALETSYANVRNQLKGEASGFGYDQALVALRYGLQRRLFRYGFVNISYGVGARATWKENTQRPQWDAFISTRLGIGLALAQPNRPLPKSDRCEVLRCFREDHQMWKWELLDLLRITDFQNMNADLSLAREQKWGDSHWSWEILGDLTAKRHKLQAPYLGVDDRSWSAGFRAQTRWYFNQQKRIARGISGNNLSGMYFAAGFKGRYTQGREAYSKQLSHPGSYKTRDYRLSQLGPCAAFGFQIRIFERGYIDWQLSPTFFRTVEQGDRDGKLYKSTIGELDFDTRLRIGLIF